MKRDQFGPHPNSITGTATPEIREALRKGRAQMYEDQRAFERWARQGFNASGSATMTSNPLDDEKEWY